ncbi:hypothetical protein GCM10010109_72250 [Actinoplanes campanulatus]|nr:hypothetical protein GCM10010109_72250 [Actinoplanes campanulatus]GID34983.1 hypothetical protein Aca09nite_14890 [Actinoplanes campanulatus]
MSPSRLIRTVPSGRRDLAARSGLCRARRAQIGARAGRAGCHFRTCRRSSRAGGRAVGAHAGAVVVSRLEPDKKLYMEISEPALVATLGEFVEM